MKLHLYLSFIVSTILYSSCSDYTDEMPNMPDPIELDINEDGIIDYLIDYREVDIESANSNFGLVGRINPNGENQVLLKKDEGNLFLRDLESIKESVNEPLSWSTAGFSKQITSISNNIDGDWPSKWEVNSNTTHSTYFMGLKILNNNVTNLGWVELDINTDNGKVNVVNKGTL